jgi:ribose 5-phosphate isomerase A
VAPLRSRVAGRSEIGHRSPADATISRYAPKITGGGERHALGSSSTRKPAQSPITRDVGSAVTDPSDAPWATARRALEFVHDGQTLGLGTGRAAAAFVEALGEKARAGLRVRGVPTSVATAELAKRVGVPLVTLAEAGELDVAFDGADEVAPNLDLVKGYGGALVRERIVASSARRFVVLVGSEKLVSALGERGKIPVEIVPYALPLAMRQLAALGVEPVLRTRSDGATYLTDNGNWILDCGTRALPDAASLERKMRALPGVVGTGLFLGVAHAVLVQDGTRVRVTERT